MFDIDNDGTIHRNWNFFRYRSFHLIYDSFDFLVIGQYFTRIYYDFFLIFLSKAFI